MIKFFRYYLFSIGILLLLRSVILLIVSLDENFLEVIESAEPLLFSADLLGLLLFGGILSTRDPKVLQRHILLSITATIIFLLIASKSVAVNKSLSFFILCAVIFQSAPTRCWIRFQSFFQPFLVTCNVRYSKFIS